MFGTRDQYGIETAETVQGDKEESEILTVAVTVT